MATREENIKKINDELEKLTDEELDDVAGGQIIWRELIFDQKKDPNSNGGTSPAAKTMWLTPSW